MASLKHKREKSELKLFENKRIAEDEVVFRFDKPKDDGLREWMSLSVYQENDRRDLEKEPNKLYVSITFLCMVSDVFESMFDRSFKYSEEKLGVVNIRDFPRKSYLAFFRMIHPRILQDPSGTFQENVVKLFIMRLYILLREFFD